MHDYSRFWAGLSSVRHAAAASRPRLREAQSPEDTRESSASWHDSSFDLRQGLEVIDTGIDPCALGFRMERRGSAEAWPAMGRREG